MSETPIYDDLWLTWESDAELPNDLPMPWPVLDVYLAGRAQFPPTFQPRGL